MKNLCINGTPITNSYHDNYPAKDTGPENAFDRDINIKFYESGSYVYRDLPYIGYKFLEPVKISSMNLYQYVDERAYKVYIIYSDNGNDWMDTENFEVDSGKNILQLSKDYGKHQYWAIQNRDGVTGENTYSEYPWTVAEIEMFGYDSPSIFIQK